MGILNLEIQNKCLLSRWLYRLLNSDGMWQTILRKKYLRSKTITQVQHINVDSQFQAGLMSVKNDFFRLEKFQLGNGSQICFWKDKWCGNRSLKETYPALYNRQGEKMPQCIRSSLPGHLTSLLGLQQVMVLQIGLDWYRKSNRII